MRPFRHILTLAAPTPLELASSELEDARRDLLKHAAMREYYAALEEMLKERIERLEQAIHNLAALTPTS
jgi:hypothetical protein